MRDPFEHNEPAPAEKHTNLLLWAGFLLNPLAMGVNTIVGYTVAHWISDTGRKHYSYLVSAIDLLLCLCAFAISISLYRKFRESDDDAPFEGRRLFMAKLAILVSVMTVLLLIGQTLAVATLHTFD